MIDTLTQPEIQFNHQAREVAGKQAVTDKALLLGELQQQAIRSRLLGEWSHGSCAGMEEFLLAAGVGVAGTEID
jgi:hypothetical protein